MPQAEAEKWLYAGTQAEVAFRNRTFAQDQYTPDNIRRLAAYLTGDSAKFGVMLCGVPGNGKTSLLYAFQNAHNLLNDFVRFPQPYDRGITIVDAVWFAMKCRDADQYKEWADRPMLGLEDIGRDAEQLKVYGDPITPVIDIIEYRYARQLFTFVTTNLTLKELQAKYGSRVADRFNEMEIIVFNKPDSYRRL